MSSLTTAASGVRGLILALITPKSPIIATIIGLSPAETATGIAITGIIARHGIEPGPIPLKDCAYDEEHYRDQMYPFPNEAKQFLRKKLKSSVDLHDAEQISYPDHLHED